MADIGKRLDDAADKEKELIKQEESFHARDAKIKECEMDIELRYKNCRIKKELPLKKKWNYLTKKLPSAERRS